MLFGISLKWKKIIFCTICFIAFDKAQVALLGVMECVHLSEKTKFPLKFHSLCDCCSIQGPLGKVKNFCGRGFVSLLWLQHIMQHRSRSQCESAFLASACVHV